MTNSTSQKIVGSTYTKNNMTYLVVDNDTIREESNLLRFLNGDINFDTSLVTDFSELFTFRNLINCKDSFNDWDLSNLKKCDYIFKGSLENHNAVTHLIHKTVQKKLPFYKFYIKDEKQPILYNSFRWRDCCQQSAGEHKKINFNKKLIVGDIIIDNDKKYLVVDNETIRNKKNLISFFNREINFITTLVTDISFLFSYTDLSFSQDMFVYWDFSNITNFENAFSFAHNVPKVITDKILNDSTKSTTTFKESIRKII